LTILSPTRNPPTTSVRRPLVLCYHAVSPTWEHRLSIHPDLLLAQVRALRRFRRLCVSFDDAFRSAASVIPPLRTLGVPIEIFVCTGFARDGASLTIPELAGDDPEQLATMTWPELRELADEGIAIGSHGVSHAHLPALSDEELRRELVESKDAVESEVGRPCRALAYPYGEHDERVRSFAREAGYECAYALRERRGDRYAVPRLDLYRRHSPTQAVLLSTPLHGRVHA
jgi:peptidoglycan/xylan/chitin deacetylase (PgdA/CDA1 family)